MWSSLKRIIAKSSFISLALLSISPLADAAIISLVPQSDSVVVGQALEVDVVASLDPAEDLAAYFIDIVYDALALRFESVAISDALGDLAFDAIDVSLPPAVFGNLGVINIAVESFLADFSSQANDLLLATLSYTVLMPGAVALEFGAFPALDDPNLLPIDTDVVNAEISAVPVSAPAFLIAIGAFAFSAARRQRA